MNLLLKGAGSFLEGDFSRVGSNTSCHILTGSVLFIANTFLRHHITLIWVWVCTVGGNNVITIFLRQSDLGHVRSMLPVL